MNNTTDATPSTPEELKQLEDYVVKITNHMNNAEQCWVGFEELFQALSPKHQELCSRLNHAINIYVTT